MMKTRFPFVFLFLIVIATSSFSQQYSKVIEVPNKTSKELYSSAREWFAKTFVSANDVLQMDDLETGKLIGKGIFLLIDWTVNFNLEVIVKDGRYKYDLSNIMVTMEVDGIPLSKVDFKIYLDQKDYYRKGSDITWLKDSVIRKQNIKMNNKFVEITASMNHNILLNIEETERLIEEMFKSLEASMFKNNDW